MIPVDLPGWPARLITPAMFEDACVTISCDAVVTLAAEFEIAAAAASTHWPWIALASDTYRRRSHEGRDRSDIKPAQMGDLLRSIGATAMKLEQGIRQLEAAAGAALLNGNTLKGMAYSMAEQQLKESVPSFDELPPDLDEPEACRLYFENWRLKLFALADGAEDSASRLVRDLGAGAGGGPRIVGATGLISLLASVWVSLTGRRPSAERAQSGSFDDAPFVRFVYRTIDLSDPSLPRPSGPSIRTILNNNEAHRDRPWRTPWARIAPAGGDEF